MKHAFTDVILSILRNRFGDSALFIFESSPLLQYLNVKMRSANRGSKARGAFANHYALYILIEDYISQGFVEAEKGLYARYEGARFTDLLRRQRELPFGAKLQNHALNSRLNDEFTKYFPTLNIRPILRDQTAQRYWIVEQLLYVKAMQDGKETIINIAKAVIEIINAYIATKQSAFKTFLTTCRQIAALPQTEITDAIIFIKDQLKPDVDARIFEIVSFAILKAHYGQQSIFWGWELDQIQEENLSLYKTGRTNANDGGIDFVMKPLGRFFQVTETIDVNKYFLDIDKIQRFPLTFVIKTTQIVEVIYGQLREQATLKYGIDAVVQSYMAAIEEIINIPLLLLKFEEAIKSGHLEDIMSDISQQSRVEFNYEDDSLIDE